MNGEQPKPQLQIATDGGSPRLAVFVWLDNGECHQVQLNMGQRKAVYGTIERMHDFTMKVSAQTLPILWPSKEEK